MLGEPIYDRDDNEGDVLHRDGNKTLVVKKTLLTPKGDSGKNWLRINISHITYTIFEKVCKLIIDI